MAILSELITRMRNRLRDTDTTNPRITDAQYKILLNSGYNRLVAKYQFIEAITSLIADGVNWVYTLRGSSNDNVSSTYLGMRQITPTNSPPLQLVDIKDIERLEQGGLIVAGKPTQYALYGGKVHFDAVPPAPTNIITDTDSADFTDSVGDWTADTGNTIDASAADGEIAANELTISSLAANTSLASLTGGASDLVIGKHYVLRLKMKIKLGWGGGVVTVTIGSSFTNVVASTLTTSYQIIFVKFKAQETNSDIVITCASTPAAADYVRIDDVFLAQSTLAVSHFTTPTALSASGDEPEFPLNVLDGMLISAAIAEHGDDIGNPTMIRNAEEKMRRLHSEFVKLIEGQGKHQIAQASDYYLSQGVEGFELDIS